MDCRPTLLPFATATSTCLSLLSTCSGLCPFLGISASLQYIQYLVFQPDTFEGVRSVSYGKHLSHFCRRPTLRDCRKFNHENSHLGQWNCLGEHMNVTAIAWRLLVVATRPHPNGRGLLCVLGGDGGESNSRSNTNDQYVYLVQSLFGDLCLAADRTPTPRKMSSATHFRRSLTSRAIVFVGVAG